MEVLFYLLLCISHFDNVASKCNTLLMCPSFCMKVKQGCYVCDCGMFSNYLHRAAEHMASASNKQPSQTGTQLSSYTSGYRTVGNNRRVPNIQNGQSVLGYSNMMQMGFQYMNLQPHDAKPLVPQMSAPDFTDYGHGYKNMPGMNCAPVDGSCPSACWTTDVYTGCVHCGCAHVNDGHNDIPQHRSTESSVSTAEEHAPSEYTDMKGIQSQTGKNYQTPTEQTSVLISTSIHQDIPTANVAKILVPTKPPKATFTPSQPDFVAQNPHMEEERVTKPTFRYGNIKFENLGIAVPTPLPTSSYGSVLPMSLSYAVPTPRQNVNNSVLSSLISFRTPELTLSENITKYPNHINYLKTPRTKTKTKEQFDDGLTTASGTTGVRRDFNGNNTVEIGEQIEQSTRFNLEHPLKLLITTQTTTYRKTTENTSSIPLHPSLANTGNLDFFHDKTSESTTREDEHYGFYVHAKTG